MHELALFAGAGGGILGGQISGWRTKCAVEIDPYARSVLLARQRDGFLPRFPIWDDIKDFNGAPWRGEIDVVSGGFPCQDISSAGKRQGLAGERSGLWFDMLRVIGEVQPRFVFAENSPHLRTNGLGTVIEGLASLGYDCRWCVLGAWHAGGPHRRNRMWILAYADNGRERILPGHAEMAKASETSDVRRGVPANTDGKAIPQQQRRGSGESRENETLPGNHRWWDLDCIQGVDDGVAHRVDRIRATGNGQVPIVAAMAWQILSGG